MGEERKEELHLQLFPTDVTLRLHGITAGFRKQRARSN